MLVSVVVPTYNAESFLENTLSSIVNQTYRELEIFVVDDGSSDNTREVVSKMNDNRIQFIALTHQGAPGHCRNRGLLEAKGEVLIYFDSDDYMEPTMVEEMVKVYKEENVDLVICQPRYKDIVNNKIVSNEQEKFFMLETYTYNDLFSINPFPCNKLYRRSFLIDSQVFYAEKVFNQDLGYFLCLVFHKPTFKVCKKVLMEYRIRPNSITTSTKTRKKHMDILTVFDQVFTEYEKCKAYDVEYGLYEMFIKTMIFKMSFFDLQKDQEEIKTIRNYLYQKAPKWYARKEYKAYYSFKKRVYNTLVIRMQLYSLIGKYKQLKKG